MSAIQIVWMITTYSPFETENKKRKEKNNFCYVGVMITIYIASYAPFCGSVSCSP